MKYYAVKYKGAFAFIKPYSSFRDITTFSQQFLTKSTLIGIELEIFENYGYIKTGDVNCIKRYKLTHKGFTQQQEVIKSTNIRYGKKKGELYIKDGGEGIIFRNVLTNPELILAFDNKEKAEIAYDTLIRLSRMEDFMYPVELFEINEEDFNNLKGFETFDNENGFLCGYNRFKDYEQMLIDINYVL
jgi:hypothetical protein